jgi:arginine utilization protein RocB
MNREFNKDKQINTRVTESKYRIMKALKKEMGYSTSTAIDYFIKEQKSVRGIKIAIHELEELKKEYELSIYKINIDLKELMDKLDNSNSDNEIKEYDNVTQKSIESIIQTFKNKKEQYHDINDFLNADEQIDILLTKSKICFIDIDELKQAVKFVIQK